MSSSNTKKRRVGDKPADSDNNELIAMKSSIDELVHQNRTQNENIANILQLMKGMQDEMKDIRGEIKDMRGEITQLRQKNEMKDMRKDMNGMKKEVTKLTKKCNGMEKVQKDIKSSIDNDMSGRFDIVDEKQKYHEMILKNQKWEYSASSLTVSYFDSIGADQRGEVEKFLKKIQKYTEEMRYGTSNGNIDLDFDGVQYNEELLPHWKEFAAALKQYKYDLKFSPKDNKSKLQLNGMELADEVVELLSKALKSTHFHKFELGSNNMGQKGIDFALDYLRGNDKCEQFALDDNVMGKKDIQRLCEILNDHPSLNYLSLIECKGGDIDGHEMLQMIKTSGSKRLKNVLLDRNSITGGDVVSGFLENNDVLEYLSLTHNELDDNNAMMIANVLKHNTTLRLLEIGDNRITDVGWVALGKAVFNNVSLNSAAGSNHTCLIDFPSNGLEIVREMNGRTNCPRFLIPRYVRQKKIYTVLSSRNRSLSNVDHFSDDMPVELLPDMLSTIQVYSDYHIKIYTPHQDTLDVKPLSIMFEILQRWDKSLAVFESLGP